MLTKHNLICLLAVVFFAAGSTSCAAQELDVNRLAMAKVQAYLFFKNNLREFGAENSDIKEVRKKVATFLASSEGDFYSPAEQDTSFGQDIPELGQEEKYSGWRTSAVPYIKTVTGELPLEGRGGFILNEDKALAVLLGNDEFCEEFLGSTCQEAYQPYYDSWQKNRDKLPADIQKLLFDEDVSLCTGSKELGAKFAENVALQEKVGETFQKNVSEGEDWSWWCPGQGPGSRPVTFYVVQYQHRKKIRSTGDLVIQGLYTATWSQ